jgi:hypothetical protein
MIDQSQSLKTSDPEGDRIPAALALVDGLASASSDISIELRVAGFGGAVKDIEDFRLPEQVENAKSKVRQVASKRDDPNTDYMVALLGAIDYFDKRTGADTRKECRQFIWFTDGAYDLDVYNPEIAKYAQLDVASLKAKNDPVFEKLEGGFETYVCGEGDKASLPDSPLRSPLIERIRSANFTIDLIDFNNPKATSADQREKRKVTQPVLDRMFNDDDTCGGVGRLIPVQDTVGLVKSFFIQGQKSIGRDEFDCRLLADGVPISAVRALAAAASEGDITVTYPDNTVEQRTSTVSLVISDERRGVDGDVKVTGELSVCYVELVIAVEIEAAPFVLDTSTSAEVRVVVTGNVTQTKVGQRLDDRLIDIDVKINGEDPQTPIRWDGGAAIVELGDGTTAMKNLFEDGTIDITAQATLTQQRHPRTPFPATPKRIEISDTPRAVDVKWEGPTSLEDEESIKGKLIFDGGKTFDGELKVTLGRLSSTAADLPADPSIQTASLRQSDAPPLNIEVTGQPTQSAPMQEEVVFEVVITPSASRNLVSTVSFAYEATYTKADTSTAVRLRTEPYTVTITQVKSASTTTGALFALALAVLVALLAYLLLFGSARLQGRLTDPTRLRHAVAGFESVASNGVGQGRFVLTDEFSASGLRNVRGSRSSLEFDTVSVRQAWPINPLGQLRAIVTSSAGSIVAIPSLRGSASGRRLQMPARFHKMACAEITKAGCRVHVLLPPSATGDDFRLEAERMLNRLDGDIRSLLAARADSTDNEVPERPKSPGETPLVDDPPKPPPGPAVGGGAPPPPPPSRPTPPPPPRNDPPAGSGRRPPGPPSRS